MNYYWCILDQFWTNFCYFKAFFRQNLDKKFVRFLLKIVLNFLFPNFSCRKVKSIANKKNLIKLIFNTVLLLILSRYRYRPVTVLGWTWLTVTVFSPTFFTIYDRLWPSRRTVINFIINALKTQWNAFMVAFYCVWNVRFINFG